MLPRLAAPSSYAAPVIETNRRPHPGWLAATIVSVVAVLFLTLRPDSTVNSANFVPFREHGAAWSCLLSQCSGSIASAKFLISDVLGNIVVFIPIGYAAAGSLLGRSDGRRFLMTVGGGMLLSLFIETVQFQIATRATDVDDLIFNTLGTAIGAAALIIRQRQVARREASSW